MIARLRGWFARSIAGRTKWYASVYVQVIETLDEQGALGELHLGDRFEGHATAVWRADAHVVEVADRVALVAGGEL